MLNQASQVGLPRKQAHDFLLGGWHGLLGEEADVAQANRDTDFR